METALDQGTGTRAAGATGHAHGSSATARGWWLRADNGLERRWEWNGNACGRPS